MKLKLPYFNTGDHIYDWLYFWVGEIFITVTLEISAFRSLFEHCSIVLQTFWESCLHFYVFSFDRLIYSDYCCMYKNPRLSRCSSPTKLEASCEEVNFKFFFFFLNLEKDCRGKGGQIKSVRQPLVIPSSSDFCYSLTNTILIPFIPAQE